MAFFLHDDLNLFFEMLLVILIKIFKHTEFFRWVFVANQKYCEIFAAADIIDLTTAQLSKERAQIRVATLKSKRSRTKVGENTLAGEA